MNHYAVSLILQGNRYCPKENKKSKPKIHMMNLFYLFTSRYVLPWSKKCSWQLRILYGRRSGFTVLNHYDCRKKVLAELKGQNMHLIQINSKNF